jgi:isoamylase
MGRHPGSGPGASLTDGVGTFRLRCREAERVELCLFDRPSSRRESSRHELSRTAGGLWEVALPCGDGQLYGYRVAGPWDPEEGLRLNPSKVLLDPWALRVGRMPRWHDGLAGQTPTGNPDRRDSAAWAPLAAVVDLSGLPSTGRRPRIDPDDLFVYEAHLKGLTALHPEVPERLRGTFLGAAHPRIVEHLVRMGVTTLELLPVQAHADDRFLVERSLSNYWGYSTLGYFAPHPAYAQDPARIWSEWRTMVRAFHEAGIEVVLDVVYNHTCEGPFLGPQLSWRGLGSPWYRRQAEHPNLPEDFTGCGNTMDFRGPDVVDFCVDSLAHWRTLGGVDGFRFDLASVHGRLDGRFDPGAPFFERLRGEPALEGARLIAEPWDATWDGYGVGKFPAGWFDWNDKFRDDLRRFWRGDDRAEAAFATRFAGSPELFGDRPARESLNFAACHDGFTLHDLCAYSRKHNLENGEGNRDGSDHEVSDNLGTEGPSRDPLLNTMRARRARNLLASVLIAPGTPMLLAGDERARTQRGNNNAYCQDNEISWLDWVEAPSGWPDDTWIASLMDMRRSLLKGATWTPVPHDPGVVRLTWRTATSEGLLLAQSAGPLRNLPLPGRFRLWLDTSTETADTPSLLAGGSLLLRPGSLVLLEHLHAPSRI